VVQEIRDCHPQTGLVDREAFGLEAGLQVIHLVLDQIRRRMGDDRQRRERRQGQREGDHQVEDQVLRTYKLSGF